MRLLPSGKEEKIGEAISWFLDNGTVTIQEPCNCGSNIRHNNGGHYHEIVTLKRDHSQVFVMYDSTCELTPPAAWQECHDWRAVIAENADWL